MERSSSSRSGKCPKPLLTPEESDSQLTFTEHSCCSSILQLEDLVKEFSGEGNFVVCPGYTASFGSLADKWGKLYVPGATAGYKSTRSMLLGWRQKSQDDERFSWWPAEMAEKGIEPVKVSLVGLLLVSCWICLGARSH